MKIDQNGFVLGTPKTQPVNKMPHQKVIKALMQERRRKRLCYFCDEKQHQGRRCVKQKLYLLEGMDMPSSSNVDSDGEQEQKIKIGEEVVEDYLQIASISLHAMMGAPNPKTMRILGHLKKKWVVILVDTISTHNFVDTSVTSKC